MSPPTTPRLLRPVAVLMVAAVPPATAQQRDLEFSYGRWLQDSATVTYTGAYVRQLLGPFYYGLGVTHVEEQSGAERLRQTGGEVSLGLWRDGAGPYLVAGAGLGMRHEDGNLDAQWSAGGGYAVRPLGFVSLGIEARYRVEDRSARGFWRLDPSDRRGLMLQGRVAIALGGASTAAPTIASSEPEHLPPPSESRVTAAARRDGASGEAATLRVAVVQTALDAMGTPYQWGGSDEDGFDCSGLIQYAYGEHGLILPRLSRDQARMGMQVGRDVEALLPGDILGFSVERAAVTHVGLYVGDGMFIHSSSSGVRLTSLTATDPDSRWWQQRWVTARRVIN